jgi:hypothetical protein
MDVDQSGKRNRKGGPVRRVVAQPPPPAGPSEPPAPKLINGYMTFLDLYTWCAERLGEEVVLHYLAKWKLSFASELSRDVFREPIARCVNAVLAHTRQGLSIAPSRIEGAGYGLFTNVARGPADGPFAEYGGIRMSDDFYLLHNLNGTYMIGAGDGTYIDGELRFRLSEPARWANTTADPRYHNVVLHSSPGDSRVFLRASRDIAAGEELYCYYGPDYEMAGLGNPKEEPVAETDAPTELQCIVCGRADVEQRCSHCHVPICARACFDHHIDHDHGQE